MNLQDFACAVSELMWGGELGWDKSEDGLNKLYEVIVQLKKDNKVLRGHAWLNHSHCAGMPYGDDGEMQCCHIDFKRDSVDDIMRKIQEKALRKIKEHRDALDSE